MSQATNPTSTNTPGNASSSSNLPANKAGAGASSVGHLDAEQPNKPYDALHTEFGDTSIADQVVQKIAGLAARDVDGVYAMGNIAQRTLGTIAGRIQGQSQNVTGGVAINKGDRETAVDLSVIVEYGYAIAEVCQNIRESVINAVEHGTGLTVKAVNVSVNDVHLPNDEKNDNSAHDSTTPVLGAS